MIDFIVINLVFIIIIILFWIGIIYRRKIQRIYFGIFRNPHLVAHLYVKGSETVIEKKRIFIELGKETFKHDDQEYIVDTRKAVWQPTGLFGTPELHLHYQIGLSKPLSFYEPKAPDSELQEKVLDKKVIISIMKGMKPSTFEFNFKMFLIIAAVIVAAVAIYLIVMGAMPTGGEVVVKPR